MSIQDPVDLGSNDATTATRSNSSYSIEVNFNYVSQGYDDFQLSIDEVNLSSVIDNVRKDDFLGIKKKSRPSIINFSRGKSMKNFVMPRVTNKDLSADEFCTV